MNTIKVKKYSNVIVEYVAEGIITPGHLLELTSVGKVQAHTGAGHNIIPLFAIEDELQGNGIDDNYSTGDQVQSWIPYRGDIVYALLKDGQDVSIGDLLESAGDGTLQVHIPDGSADINYTNQVVGVAVEAVDLSASANTTAGRIQIQVL